MDFSTEITIMGRNGDSDLIDKIREPLARGIQKTFNGDTIFMQDVKSFVTAVVARADGGKIKRLNIHDHGNNEGCYFGRDWITTDNFAEFAPFFGKINAYLTKSAIVYLGHCEMGQMPDLMRMFALTFGVRVYAGTGIDAAAPFNNNTGDYVGCTPAGTMFKEMHRP